MTKPMVIIEPAGMKNQDGGEICGILGLGSRLYPGNMQRIFKKDLTRFIQSLSRERQNRASKRKALLAGWVSYCDGTDLINQKETSVIE